MALIFPTNQKQCVKFQNLVMPRCAQQIAQQSTLQMSQKETTSYIPIYSVDKAKLSGDPFSFWVNGELYNPFICEPI